MTARAQKRLAVAGALAGVMLFAAANAHLLSVAFNSQPECSARANAMPARRAC